MGPSGFNEAGALRLRKRSFAQGEREVIVEAILDGRQPASLTVCKILHLANLPLDWQDQRAHTGFPPKS